MEQTENQLPKIEWTGYFFSILRSARRLRVWVLLFVIVTAAMVGLLGWSSHTPVYEASVSFTVKVANPLYAGVNAYNEKTAEQMAKTFPYILTSTALRQRVQEYLDIGYVPAVSAKVHEGSNIFSMSVQNTDPQRAWQVLDAVMVCYPEVAEFVVGATKLVQLDSTGVPSAPVNPFSMKRTLIYGAAAGFLLWLAFCAVDAFLRTTIRDEEALKKLLNLPCLCSVPVTKVLGKMLCPLVSRDRSKVGFGESIRMLRIRVERKMEQMDKKVVMVSSARPGEGKTTVTVNLAISMVQSGKKVLIVDCDMYNPSVARALQGKFGKSRQKIPLTGSGMTANLCSIAMKNLYTVVFGSSDGSPPRQITKEDLTQLIQYVQGPFDCIILDTPPCSLIAETVEVAEVADCGILVIRQDYSSKDQILDGVRLLADSGLPLIGCVFNGVDGRMTPGGYQYGYGYGYGYGRSYGYGYGYGYGADEESVKTE